MPQTDVLLTLGGAWCSTGNLHLSTQLNLQRAGSPKHHETHCACQHPLYPVLPYHLALESLRRDPKLCTPLSNNFFPYLNSPVNMPSCFAQGKQSFCPWPDHTQSAIKSWSIASTLPASEGLVVPQFP